METYEIFKDLAIIIIAAKCCGLLARKLHAPMVAGLIPHAMRVKLDGKEQLIAVAGGFMEVQPEKITVLASAAELTVDIDVMRAQKSYERAKERLEALKAPSAPESDVAAERATASLHRAMARLTAAGEDVQ